MGSGPLFLNTPISSADRDIVGVSTLVDKLNSAIDKGARMIAITSPFGSGKSSVIELLQSRRHSEKKATEESTKENGKLREKEQFVFISMWSHLSKNHTEKSAELHKTFVYQLISEISPKRGTYVSRRLSKNYGVLRLHTNKMRYWIMTLIAITLLILCWMIKTFDNWLQGAFPWLAENATSLSLAFLLCAIALGVIILTRADIIFSSNKSEGQRIVEEDEIIDLYRTEILKPRAKFCGWKNRKHRGTHYIVVIEDLDRTDDPDAVLCFLKELRKYYMPESSEAELYRNQVTFLVTIKPEPILISSLKETHNQGDANQTSKEPNEGGVLLYGKIFDYVLNLQTINIDNYDAILVGLLREHENELKEIGINFSEKDGLASIPGLQWIIREPGLGIREIKERLNLAFTLYESLIKKFPQSTIDLAKCAAAAYLMTAFGKDFHNSKDDDYQRLVDMYLKNSKSEDFGKESNYHENVLKNTDIEYRKAVSNMVRAGLIDSTYRIYFYSYPKDSYLYSSDELIIQNAILSGEKVDGLEGAIANLENSSTRVIRASYDKLKGLEIPLPRFLFEVEPLFIVALQFNLEECFVSWQRLDYSVESAMRTMLFFQNMLSFDKERKIFSREIAQRLCALWEDNMSETSLLQFRQMLCEKFPDEILWYRPLFLGEHNIIRNSEINLLRLEDALHLINKSSKSFSEEHLYTVVELFAHLDQQDQQSNSATVETFLRDSLKVLDIEKSAVPILNFMHIVSRIIPDFEQAIVFYLKAEIDDEDLQTMGERDNVFRDYQHLINETASTSLSTETAANVSSFNKLGFAKYDNYTVETAARLREYGYTIDYVLILLCLDENIDYSNEAIQKSIKNNIYWTYEHHVNLFWRLRLDIVQHLPSVLNQYSFLFTVEFPIISKEELQSLSNLKTIDTMVISLIPPELVTDEELNYLCKFFCRQTQNNSVAHSILCFIAKVDPVVAKDFFYGLDFNKIRYHSFAAYRKSSIKILFNKILGLSEPESKLKFMQATNFLDANFETELLSELVSDNELQQEYAGIVNQSRKLSTKTISVLTSMGKIYGMQPRICEEVFQAKKFSWYVASKTNWEAKFIMEDGERGNLLWDTYVSILFAEENSYSHTRKLMLENENFLYTVMQRKSYQKCNEEARMRLAGILQDAASIQNVIGYGSDFALEYLKNIGGFQDSDAAKTFLECVIADDILLSSDELYNHTHEQLVDGNLKSRYTKKWKNAKHMK